MMYEAFFGFRERPFDLASNPRFMHWTPQHQEALSNVRYGLTSRKPLTLLVGDAGTGKTSVLAAAVEEMNGAATLCHLNNPTLTRDEFMEAVANKFELSKEAATSKTRLLQEMETKLTELRNAGRVAALVVDESQSLPDELLEEIRLLVNLQAGGETLLPVILAGQPELAERLNRDSLRQIKQRVALRCVLAPLDTAHTGSYIARRITVAGGKSYHVFTREAVRAIHAASRGVPRVISVICDNALLSGFALGVRPVTRAIVEEVCRDFDLMLNGRAVDDPVALVPVSRSQAGKPAAADSSTKVSQVPAADAESSDPVAADEPAPEPRSVFGTIGRKRGFLRF